MKKTNLLKLLPIISVAMLATSWLMQGNIKSESYEGKKLGVPMPTVELQPEAKVEVFGAYSNMKGDGEHSWGYTVRLWKYDGKLVGVISGQEFGLNGDPATGILEDLEYDETSRKISFKAKMTFGVYSNGEPSKDLVLFEGVLKPHQFLKGEITIADGSSSGRAPKGTKARLKYSKDWTEPMDEYSTFEEWKEYADAKLRRSGPKW
ncbi:MAG: hypothetical protein R2684_04220 [Pyrinomonadaceae bacterium]